MSLLDLRLKYFRDFCHIENGVAITVNPAWLYHEQYQYREAYPRNEEPQWRIHMPSIELYSNDLRAAKFYIKDRRRINGQRRRGARRSGLNF